jgi:tRNA 2-selenouridine synthase
MPAFAKQLHITDFLTLRSQGIVIDVRTPAEFAKGHMPGSYNMPLFTNEERAIIGTTYKQIGRDEAIEQGLAFVGPRMADMVKQAKALANNRPVFVYCWRGGMRSGSVAWLLQMAGMQVNQLVGGYKAYRNHFYKLLKSHPWQFIVIGGRTGSGKTEILTQLDALGQQVVDLEKRANHKGSAFGALGQLPQPSSEHFENLLHEDVLFFDPSLPIWIEGESQRIGSCFIPMQLFDLMQSALYLNITLPASNRIERLVRDYASFPAEKLIDATLNIKKRLGGLVLQQAIEAIQNGDYALVAQLTLGYYDKTYDYCYTERHSDKQTIEFDHGDPFIIANYLTEQIKTN